MTSYDIEAGALRIDTSTQHMIQAAYSSYHRFLKVSDRSEQVGAYVGDERACVAYVTMSVTVGR